MKILLLGEVYSTNLGDALICQTVQNLIHRQYPGCQTDFFDISGRVDWKSIHPDSFFEKLFVKVTERVHLPIENSPHYALFKNNEFRYLRATTNFRKLNLNSYDAAVFCGGALFQDFFAGIIELIVHRLSMAGVPVVFHACGMGPLSKNGEFLLSKAFCYSNVKSISLRDSMERFQQLFATQHVPQETYDTALCCCEFVQPSSVQLNLVGLGIINRDTHISLQKNLISQFLHNGISFRVFTNGADRDYQMAVTLLRECGCSDLEVSHLLLRRPQTPEDLIHDISSFSKVISFRMHSLIIATAYAIDNRGLVWDEKVRSFYNSLGLHEFAVDPAEKVDFMQYVKSERIDPTILSEKASFAANKSKAVLFRSIEEAVGGV